MLDCPEQSHTSPMRMPLIRTEFSFGTEKVMLSAAKPASSGRAAGVRTVTDHSPRESLTPRAVTPQEVSTITSSPS